MNEKDHLPQGVSDNALLTDDSRTEQRKYRRFPTNLAARIHWKDDSGNLQSTSGTIIDMSAEGFGIELARSFPEGTLLSVATQEGILHGVVRHEQEHPATCRLGVELLSWTEGWNVGRNI
jgi:PilZ domain